MLKGHICQLCRPDTHALLNIFSNHAFHKDFACEGGVIRKRRIEHIIMKLGYLAENKEAIPILANWYFDEWGYIEKGNSIENITNNLNDYLNTDKMPLIILAIDAMYLKLIANTGKITYSIAPPFQPPAGKTLK